MVPFVEPFTKLMNQGQVIMAGKAMSKTLGNLVNLQEQIAAYGPDAVRVTMVFAGPPEDDIDWADVSPTGAMKWLARVWRLTGDIGVLPAPSEPDLALRRSIHKLIAEATTAMDTRRLNVGISRLMELTNLLRRAVDTGVGPGHPTVREGAEALVRMLSCFAPFTAEEGWERLGHEPSIVSAGWPQADPTLLVEDTVTCILQVDGKLRDRVDVPADSADDQLTAIALASERVQAALAGATVGRVIVRAPKLVNVVTTP
jgi:leucyl-tRNA synthetase